ncbi:hypothetical protein D3C80_691600 [compost metagenome]
MTTASDDTVMIVPSSRASIPGRTACVRLNTAVRLTLIVEFHSSSLMKRALRTLLADPALLTRMSIGPTASSIDLTVSKMA